MTARGSTREGLTGIPKPHRVTDLALAIYSSRAFPTPSPMAALIAMVTLSQLPIGPSVGAAAVVLILGVNGAALAAAAGVLLTATGTLGALAYAAWAGSIRCGRCCPHGPAPPDLGRTSIAP
jgi:hypothetical protein